MKLKFNFFQIIVLTTSTFVLFVTGFNCALSKMHSLQGSNDSLSMATKAEDYPYALLNGEQILSSMLNLTEQTSASQQVRNEYNLRNTTFSTDNYLNSMSASMFLSATSLAGEVCNSLVAKEKALAVDQRSFFTSINFSLPPMQITINDYMNSAQIFSNKIWGRSLASTETDAFEEFYKNFQQDLAANEKTQAAKTSALSISICTAFLASFETLIF